MSEVEFRTDMAGVEASMVDGLFVGWPDPPDADQLLAVMAGAHRRVWALADGRVVGYICAISDGVLNAFIPWLEVHPAHQHQGLGTELVRRLVEQLDDMYAIDLLCDVHLVPWYESLGFMPCPGAGIRRPAAIIRGRSRARAWPEVEAVVRPLRHHDADDVLDAFTASDDMARRGDVRDIDSARAYVEGLLAQGRRAFVVEHEAHVAVLVALQVDARNRTGWFFYWTHAAHRGLGLAARGAASVATWALDAGGLDRLELGYRVDNPSSASVARAAGFVVEGRERGKFLMGGRRVDVITAARLASDAVPGTPLLPVAGGPWPGLIPSAS